jgi:hypothetical protein
VRVVQVTKFDARPCASKRLRAIRVGPAAHPHDLEPALKAVPAHGGADLARRTDHGNAVARPLDPHLQQPKVKPNWRILVATGHAAVARLHLPPAKTRLYFSSRPVCAGLELAQLR